MIGNDECDSAKTTEIYRQSAAKGLSQKTNSDTVKVQRPFREEVDPKRGRSARHQKKWSRKYDYCVVCDTTEFKHQARGVCSSCSKEERRKQNKEWRMRRYSIKEYREQKLARSRKWKRDNPEKIKAYSVRNYKEKREKLLRQKNEFNHGGNYWAVLERDNFTCQRCGRHPVYLVHHTGESHAKDKQVTLCKGCHSAIHKSRKVLERYSLQCSKDTHFFDEDMVSAIKRLIES